VAPGVSPAWRLSLELNDGMVEPADHTSALRRAKGDWSFKSRPSFFVRAEGVCYFEPEGRAPGQRDGLSCGDWLKLAMMDWIESSGLRICTTCAPGVQGKMQVWR